MDVLERLRALLQVERQTGFPGPQPVALTKKSLKSLERGNRQFMVGPKTDGIRVLLFFSKDAAGKPHLARIERKLTVHRDFGDGFSEQLFAGTVLDAEFVDNTYVVFDCYALAGVSCAGRNLLVRLKHAEVAILGCHGNPRFQFKRMFPMTELRWFCEVYMASASREHACDGIIFTPVEDPMIIGTAPGILKYKLDADRTCDFLVRPVSEVSRLTWNRSFCFVDERQLQGVKLSQLAELWFIVDGLELFAVIVWPSEEVPLPACLRRAEGGMWEFKVCLEENCWFPIRPRLDKKVPNHRDTVLDTVRSVSENLHLSQLY